MNARSLLAFTTSIITLCVASVSIAEEAAGNSCAYEETREFTFPTWTDAGSATVRIVGKDCKSATLVVSISGGNGYGVFSHAATFHDLTAAPANELGAEDVKHVVARVWSLLGPRRTSELPPWIDPAEIIDEDAPAISREDYEAARALDSPYVCVTKYYEGGECYWGDPNRGVRRLLWLSDAW